MLEGVIKYRWNALPVEQRDGIKNYISDLIVQVLEFSNNFFFFYLSSLELSATSMTITNSLST